MSQDLGAVQELSFARAGDNLARGYPPDRRLTAAQLAEYLDRRDFAVLGVTRPDGRPHAVISSYVRREAVFWLPAVAGSVRERALRAQPWLTMTVTEGDRGGGHVAVLMEGPATLVPAAGVPPEVRERAGDWALTWIRFTPERLFSYAASFV